MKIVHSQRYHDFVHEKYLEKLEQYNERLNRKLNEEMASSSMSGMTMKTMDRKSFRDYSIDTISSNIPSATPDIQKDPAFKKMKRKIRRNLKFSVNDNRTGEFYFDPYLLGEEQSPIFA
jgi:hypothetical protein